MVGQVEYPPDQKHETCSLPETRLKNKTKSVSVH